MRTLIIAEAGVNHNGDVNLAKQLIDIAAEAGADIVKFQTFRADRLATQGALLADYQILETVNSESQHSMLRRLELTESAHYELRSHCVSRRIKFLSTGFDIESINMLVGLGQEMFKIPSGEITNLPYLRHVGGLKKTLILSTGMSNMEEVEQALIVLERAGTPRDRITVLHCTTAYPAPMSEVNLRAMQSIRNKLNVSIGYSDHTLGIEIPIAAVALGATIIEKHFTIDRSLPGPDHKASLEPIELKSMITAIRNIEMALGDGVKRLMPSEISNRDIARKSVVAAIEITEGQLLTNDNLTTKRPGTGTSPMEWDYLLGKKAHRNYSADELINEA
jgi:N,N'-diacetyllegionaminate synthase